MSDTFCPPNAAVWTVTGSRNVLYDDEYSCADVTSVLNKQHNMNNFIFMY